MIQFLKSELISTLTYKQKHSRIFALLALDNLVKGASDQAIQNMNIVFGLEETLGLK